MVVFILPDSSHALSMRPYHTFRNPQESETVERRRGEVGCNLCTNQGHPHILPMSHNDSEYPPVHFRLVMMRRLICIMFEKRRIAHSPRPADRINAPPSEVPDREHLDLHPLKVCGGHDIEHILQARNTIDVTAPCLYSL